MTIDLSEEEQDWLQKLISRELSLIFRSQIWDIPYSLQPETDCRIAKSLLEKFTKEKQ